MASSTSLFDYVKRIFRLYLTISSAGTLSLIVAILFASPQMQNQFGPYAWVIMLAIFLGCFVWVTASEYLHYRERMRFAIRFAMSATFTIKILNREGDAKVQGYREVKNMGSLPVKNLPPIMIGVTTYAADDPPNLNIKTNPPEGKSLNLLSHYRYVEDGYLMYAWDYQMPKGLDGGEKITYTYELPIVQRSEADAFTAQGGSIVIGSKVELYDQVSCHVEAPDGYKFVLLGVGVKDEFQLDNRSEAKRMEKLCPPQIPPARLGSVFSWQIKAPLFRHEYECRYGLVPDS
jgi:hypothetical protein